MNPVDESPIIPSELQSLVVELTRVLNAIGYRLNRVLPVDGSEGLTAYLMATRPVNPPVGAVIYVSDGGAGNVFQGWNGAAWQALG